MKKINKNGGSNMSCENNKVIKSNFDRDRTLPIIEGYLGQSVTTDHYDVYINNDTSIKEYKCNDKDNTGDNTKITGTVITPEEKVTKGFQDLLKMWSNKQRELLQDCVNEIVEKIESKDAYHIELKDILLDCCMQIKECRNRYGLDKNNEDELGKNNEDYTRKELAKYINLPNEYLDDTYKKMRKVYELGDKYRGKISDLYSIVYTTLEAISTYEDGINVLRSYGVICKDHTLNDSRFVFTDEVKKEIKNIEV